MEPVSIPTSPCTMVAAVLSTCSPVTATVVTLLVVRVSTPNSPMYRSPLERLTCCESVAGVLAKRVLVL